MLLVDRPCLNCSLKYIPSDWDVCLHRFETRANGQISEGGEKSAPSSCDRKLTRVQFSVYATKDGRISVAGITTANVKRLAESMHKVTS